MCGYSMAYLDSKFRDIEVMRKIMAENDYKLHRRVVDLEDKVLQQSEQIKQLIEKLKGK